MTIQQLMGEMSYGDYTCVSDTKMANAAVEKDYEMTAT